MSKHTPGPWALTTERKKRFNPETGEAKPDEVTTWIRGSNKKFVTCFNQYQDDYDGDAQLIATAPEMLDALKGVASMCEKWLADHGGSSPFADPYKRVLAAIAKAELE